MQLSQVDIFYVQPFVSVCGGGRGVTPSYSKAMRKAMVNPKVDHGIQLVAK